MAEPTVQITSKAARKMRELVAGRPQATGESGVRLGIKGGG